MKHFAFFRKSTCFFRLILAYPFGTPLCAKGNDRPGFAGRCRQGSKKADLVPLGVGALPSGGKGNLTVARGRKPEGCRFNARYKIHCVDKII
jgi:hypothetical protein